MSRNEKAARYLAVLILTSCLVSSAWAQKLTRGPYLQLGNTGGSYSVVVAWYTDSRADSVVEVGTDNRYQFKVSDANQVHQHIVVLKGLEPDTLYQYRIFSDNKLLADGIPFKTWPKGPHSFRFAAFGDSGSGRTPQFEIAQQILESEPHFILHTGDLVYGEGQDDKYPEKFYQPYADLIPSTIFFPTMGNHDAKTDNGAPLLQNFILPDGLTGVPTIRAEENYSFDYANAHFVSINSSLSSSRFREYVIPWLREDLMVSTKPWEIVFLHHSPYSGGPHGDDNFLQEVLVPVLEETGVDLVLTGHDHHYERFKPLLRGSVTGNFDEGAIQYIVTGAGGKSVRDADRSDRTAALYNQDYSFSSIDISGPDFRIRQINRKGKIVDDFSLSQRPFSRYDLWIRPESAAFYHFGRQGNQLGYAILKASDDTVTFNAVAWLEGGDEEHPASLTAIAPAVAARSNRVYVEEGAGSYVSFALVNPSASSTEVETSIYDSEGTLVSFSSSSLRPGEQDLLHLREIFPAVPPSFAGSIQFESDKIIAVSAIRWIVANQSVQYNYLPVMNGEDATDSLLPFLPVQEGLRSRVVVMNPTLERIRGNLRLRRYGAGEVVFRPFFIPPRGVRSFALDQLAPGLWIGHWQGTEGESPQLSGILEYQGFATATLHTTLAPRSKRTSLNLPIERIPDRLFSLAVTNPSEASVVVRLALRKVDGPLVKETEIPLPAGEAVAGYLDDLLPEVTSHFQGVLEASSSAPVFFEAFRSLNTSDGPVIATFPEFGLASRDGVLIVPLVAVGNSLRTGLQLLNGEEEMTVMSVRLRKERNKGMRVFQEY